MLTRSTISKFGSRGEDAKQWIYVPLSRDVESDPDNGFWVSLNQCLWAGLKCMRVHFCLSEIYPSCHRLFVQLLKIENASMAHFLHEARRFVQGATVREIRATLVELEKCLEKEETYTHFLTGVARYKILPVTDTATAENFGQRFNRLSKPASELFIPDTGPLLKSFVGLIPLVAFGVDDTSKMKRLIYDLGMGTKRLSRAVRSFPKTSGKVEFNRQWTDWFQSRYEFIAT